MKRIEDETLLRQAAQAYVKRTGDALAAELSALPDFPTYDGPRQLRNTMKARRRRRTAAWTLPAAACLILALLLIPPRLGGKDLSQAPDPGTGRTEIALLSEKLPAGCLLTETDYDRDKTVYHIRNARGNPIVLVAEPYVSELPTEGLTFLDLGGATAYAREGGGFCLLRVRQGEAMYTLTSAYSLQDLAEVAMSALAIDS